MAAPIVLVGSATGTPSTDISAYVDFPTLSTEDTGNQADDTATFEVVDKALSVTAMVPEGRIKVTQDGNTRFNGFITTMEPAWEGVSRRYRVSCTGISSILDKCIIPPGSDGAYARKKGETDRHRIIWLLKTFGGPFTSAGSTSYAYIQTLDRDMEWQNFANLTLRQAIERVLGAASESANYYIDTLGRLHTWDNDHEEAFDAPFDIVTTAPTSTTVPPSDLRVMWDTGDLINYYYVRGKNRAGSGPYSDATSIAAYGRRQAFIDGPDSDTTKKAKRLGKAALKDTKNPTARIFFAVESDYCENASNEIWQPGQEVEITSPAHAMSGYAIRILRVTTSYLNGAGDRRMEIECGALRAFFGGPDQWGGGTGQYPDPTVDLWWGEPEVTGPGGTIIPRPVAQAGIPYTLDDFSREAMRYYIGGTAYGPTFDGITVSYSNSMPFVTSFDASGGDRQSWDVNTAGWGETHAIVADQTGVYVQYVGGSGVYPGDARSGIAKFTASGGELWRYIVGTGYDPYAIRLAGNYVCTINGTDLIVLHKTTGALVYSYTHSSNIFNWTVRTDGRVWALDEASPQLLLLIGPTGVEQSWDFDSSDIVDAYFMPTDYDDVFYAYAPGGPVVYEVEYDGANTPAVTGIVTVSAGTKAVSVDPLTDEIFATEDNGGLRGWDAEGTALFGPISHDLAITTADWVHMAAASGVYLLQGDGIYTGSSYAPRMKVVSQTDGSDVVAATYWGEDSTTGWAVITGAVSGGITSSTATWGTTPLGLGDDTNAPWPGGNTYVLVEDDGSGSFAVSDGVATMTLSSSPATLSASLYSDDDESAVYGPWGPWADGRGLYTVTFKVAALGDLADTDPNELRLEIAGPGWTGSVIILLGDDVSRSWASTNQRGIAIAQGSTPTYTTAVTKSLSADTYYTIAFDTRGGTIKAKLWAASGTEPGTWDVEVARVADDTITGNKWALYGIGNNGDVYSFTSTSAALGAPAGTSIARHTIGYGDGSTTTFDVGQPFAGGSLQVWVDNQPVIPSSYDADAGTFTLDAAPYGDPADSTGNAIVEASWEAA